RNLRERVATGGGDAALLKLLALIAIDERAHHDFFRRCAQLYLTYDREAVLEQMRRVMHNFAMPAIDLLAESGRREHAVRKLGIFSEEIYYRDVYLPILKSLDVDRGEMRSQRPFRKSAPV